MRNKNIHGFIFLSPPFCQKRTPRNVQNVTLSVKLAHFCPSFQHGVSTITNDVDKVTMRRAPAASHLYK